MELIINPGEPLVFRDYNVPPVQPAAPDSIDTAPPFTRDDGVYGRDENYPGVFAKADPPSDIRGQPATIVWLYPYQYNPVTRVLSVYPDMEVKVVFSGNPQGLERRLRAPAFDNMFKRVTANAADVLALPVSEAMKNDTAPDVSYGGMTNGCDFLIICPSAYTNAARTLAEWKCRRGLITEVVTTNETGSTTNSIRDYIKNAYDTWDPAPAYVLLIGDSDQIPTWYMTNHPYSGSPTQGMTGTDFYYSDMSEPFDYTADLAIGRWPVDTAEQAEYCAQYAVEYEQSPPDPADYSYFYTNSTHAGAFQDGSSGEEPDHYADRRFAKTSEDVRNFMLNEGFNAQRVYSTYNGFNGDHAAISPSNWSTNASYVFENDVSGAALPAELLKPGFAWDDDDLEISSAVNNGTFLLMHRDHGSRTSWGEPLFSTGHIFWLTNTFCKPVVFSLNCQTGWFDNETDDEDCGTTVDSECFCEYWFRRETGGVIGLVGATRISYSGHNDRFAWGLMDAIWTNFCESNGAVYSGEGAPVYRMGDVLNYGRTYYKTKFAWYSIVQAQIEIFHWFGDPTLEIWTDVPQHLNVSHDGMACVGATSITVNVTEDQAQVCCVFDNRIIGTGISSNGSSVVNLFPSPESSGDMFVTVTKHNYIPYQGTTDISDDAVMLTISSAHGMANPAAGEYVYTNGQEVVCMITNSPISSGGTQYVCTGWTGTGSIINGAGTNATFTLTNNSAIAWTWSTQFMFSASAGPGGSVSASNGWHDAGATGVTVTAAASDGYHFAGWSGDVPAADTNNNPLSLTMSQARNISACFAVNTYEITASAGENGSIEPCGVVCVSHGSSTGFTMTADSGHHVLDVLVDSVSIGPSNTYIFSNIITNHTIGVSFEADPDPGVLEFSPSSYNVDEDAGGVALFVTRTGGSDGAASVDFTSAAGTAAQGEDFVAASGELSWSDGDSSTKTITVTISDDNSIEDDEIFTVTLSNSRGAALGSDDIAIVTIRNVEEDTSPVTLQTWALQLGGSGYQPVEGDFDGDVKADLAVYHESSGYWYVLLSAGGYSLSYQKFGAWGYAPVSADFDGDGRYDLAVYHESSGYWYVFLSGSQQLSYLKFGADGYQPVPGDYDGDGMDDIAVYHESSGYWYVFLSGSQQLSYLKFGADGYQPVPGDYDGDGMDDIAVYHEATGYWYIFLSGSCSLCYLKFGADGYQPVPGDFDGDGKRDLAVYHEATGFWYIFLSDSCELSYVQYGGPGYQSMPSDYNGDNTTDAAVYDELSGYWYMLIPSTASLRSAK